MTTSSSRVSSYQLGLLVGCGVQSAAAGLLGVLVLLGFVLSVTKVDWRGPGPFEVVLVGAPLLALSSVLGTAAMVVWLRRRDQYEVANGARDAGIAVAAILLLLLVRVFVSL